MTLEEIKRNHEMHLSHAQNNSWDKHKYIKREKIDGNWRYWYKDDLKNQNDSVKIEGSTKEKEDLAYDFLTASKPKRNLTPEQEAMRRREMAGSIANKSPNRKGLTAEQEKMRRREIESSIANRNGRTAEQEDLRKKEINSASANTNGNSKPSDLYDRYFKESSSSDRKLNKKEKSFFETVGKTLVSGLKAVGKKLNDFIDDIIDNSDNDYKALTKNNDDRKEENDSTKSSGNRPYISQSDFKSKFSSNKAYDEMTADVLNGMSDSKKKSIKESYADEQYKEQAKLYNNRAYNTLNDVPKMTKKLSTVDDIMNDISVVNPNYGKGFGTERAKYTQNCWECSTAMAMRQKGYDVSAVGTTAGGAIPLQDIVWNGAKTTGYSQTSQYKNVERDIKSQGEGSYGELTMNWSTGGGHSIFYKVIGGKVELFDGQSGKHYPDASKFLSSGNDGAIAGFYVTNLTKATPTESILGNIGKRK